MATATVYDLVIFSHWINLKLALRFHALLIMTILSLEKILDIEENKKCIAMFDIIMLSPKLSNQGILS